MQLKEHCLNITLDGQFGSTGKGVLNAYLGNKDEVDLAISNAAPNAGHTYDMGDGKRVAFHLPISGILNADSLIYLCAGAIIDPIVLLKEIKEFGCSGRVRIHPRAMVLLPEHTEAEKSLDSGATKIGSTQKGVGAALAAKVARKSGVVLAKDYFPKDMIENVDVQGRLQSGETALMEVPQGFDLSINHGLSYPHCTSRDLTIGAALNDAGVHPSFLGRVAVSLRTYPIRVGHIYDDNGEKIGDSGPFWIDSDEREWEDFGLEPEYTTVTKRKRRVATFSYLQYQNMLKHLVPDWVFINFLNYFKKEHQLRELMVRMKLCEDRVGVTPEYLFGLGPSVFDVYNSYEVVKQKLWGPNGEV